MTYIDMAVIEQHRVDAERFPGGSSWVVVQLGDALAAVTAERDQARQMLADAWDEGVSFGWHSTELRTDENPYRKAGL